MKNKEKFKDELIEACKDAEFNKFFDKHIAPVYRCENNILTEGKKIVLTALWLDEEHEEKEQEVDWNKVEVDTPILVSDDENDWRRRHFSKYQKGVVYAFNNGETSWSSGYDSCWKFAKLAAPQKQQHDSCNGCAYLEKDTEEYPCSECSYNYMDRYKRGI